MDYKNNWEKSKERFRAFWENEIIDRCCISIRAPKNGGRYTPEKLPSSAEDRINFRTDGEWILKRKKEYFENTYFGGDAFPQIFLDLGAAGHAGYFKNSRYQIEDTVWFFPSLFDWEKDFPEFDAESFLYKKTLELAQYLVNESKGSFFVSMPDISGNADALAHLRGSENLLLDLLEEPECVNDALKEIQEVWFKASEAVYDIIRDNNDGGSTIGWLHTWGAGKHAQMQSDMSVMISPAAFDEFIKPELTAQSKWLDYGLYHFDGVEQIRHLDTLLSIPGIKAIQWTQVAGQPSALEFIPELKRIQAAGKGIVLLTSPGQVEPLLEQLSPKGLFLSMDVAGEDEARQVEKLVEKLSCRK